MCVCHNYRKSLRFRGYGFPVIYRYIDSIYQMFWFSGSQSRSLPSTMFLLSQIQEFSVDTSVTMLLPRMCQQVYQLSAVHCASSTDEGKSALDLFAWCRGYKLTLMLALQAPLPGEQPPQAHSCLILSQVFYQVLPLLLPSIHLAPQLILVLCSIVHLKCESIISTEFPPLLPLKAEQKCCKSVWSPSVPEYFKYVFIVAFLCVSLVAYDAFGVSGIATNIFHTTESYIPGVL